MRSDPLLRWKLTGLIATIVILLSMPLYWFGGQRRAASSPASEGAPAAAFVGSEACRDCHRNEYDKWQGSHHRWAMAEATDDSVLGDFDDARFDDPDMPARFYRRDGRFYVETIGPGGEMGEFEITYTFGWYPLQQYLVPFPGGRLQCLPIAWDVPGGRWYHLYPDQAPYRPLDPDDWLYWTRSGQNWNGMCAECHSTDLKKNYDPEQDTYATTWSEISVGCEACHGPGSAHVRWAETPEMGRSELQNAALPVRTRDLTSRELIELCAPCHSRRMSLSDNLHAHDDFLDYAIPQLLSEGRYFPDGQILDEVYVYGSFMQSKMYDRGVRCSDCHDVHSIQRVKEGNDLCLQCHRAAVYDTADHHFHKKAGEKGEPIRAASGEVLFDVGTGALCEQCHMPGRVYMGTDYRPDHSFRIPRPDLSREIGVPNACSRCHADKSVAWAVEETGRWTGRKKRPHYGTILAAGRQGDPDAAAGLAALSGDRLYPAIVRATALSLLSGYPGAATDAAFARALEDEAALMRWAALRYHPEADPARRIALAGPRVYDPVKAVRIEAARTLAGIPGDRLPSDLKERVGPGIAEYEAAMLYTADFAPSRHNLGNLYAEQGEIERAAEAFRSAIAIDGRFYPAKVNLAMLYNRMGKNEAAESLLREVVDENPALYEVYYSLGLLLVENGKPGEAAAFLAAAAEKMTDRPRIAYNLGLLYQRLGRFSEAEAALGRALAAAPENPDYLYALAVFYLQQGRIDDAAQAAGTLLEKHPSLPAARNLNDAIQQRGNP